MTDKRVETLDSVKSYLEENTERWERLLAYLDRTLSLARDRRKVPIYLTKGRIKQAESAYLKFKRKGRSDPLSITDWIGFRVLCLFQQDLYVAFDFLLDLLLNLPNENIQAAPVSHFELKEVTVFNWPSDRADELMGRLQKKLARCSSKTEQDVADGIDIAYTYDADSTDKHPVISFKVRKVKKGTGYQSVHFVAVGRFIEGDEVSCEIQLRTLLQDVWGELEHALSYKKGKIHPHISNSFQLLSRELEGKDILVSQLRELRDQETALVRYSAASAGPSKWLSYPSDFLDIAFPDSGNKKLFDEYALGCGRRKAHPNRLLWETEADQKLATIGARAAGETENHHYDYVLGMERAFLEFCRGHPDLAENTYRDVIETPLGSKQWFPFFRLGEACLAQDKVEDALVVFDRCEVLMKDTDDNLEDRYLAKVGLAYSYWSLGPEFLATAVEKMVEASTLVEAHLKSREIEPNEKTRLEFSVANNLCYYYLEHWLATPSNAEVDDAHRRKQRTKEQFECLKRLVESAPKELISSNAFDTLAWFCYQTSLKTKDDEERRRLLDEARNYVQASEHQVNGAPSRLISTSIQREHIKMILASSRV